MKKLLALLLLIPTLALGVDSIQNGIINPSVPWIVDHITGQVIGQKISSSAVQSLPIAAITNGGYGTYTLNCGGISDTAELNSALSSTNTTILVPIGVCLIDQVINNTGLSGKTIRGLDKNGSIIRTANGVNPAFTLFDYNNGAGGALSNVIIENLTFDANQANNTGNDGIFIFRGSAAYADMTFRNCLFINTGTYGGVVFNSSGVINRINILDNKFDTSTGRPVYLNNTSYVNISRNNFRNYNTSLGLLPAIGLNNSTSNNNYITINNNVFDPVTSTEFAVESTGSTTNMATAVAFTGNTCNNNGNSGCGVSGYFLNSTFSGNNFYNGNFGDRTAFEVVGSYNVFANNSLYNSQINAVGSSSASYVSVGDVVIGNAIYLSSATNTSVVGIGTTWANDIIISNNTVITNYTGTANGQAMIYIGTYGSAGPINNALVTGNIGVTLGANADKCFRLLTTASSHVTFNNNVCVGTVLNSSIFLPSTSVDTDLTVTGNDFSGANVGILGAPTGTGLIIGNNKLANATQWVQPGGVPVATSIGGCGTTPSITGNNPAAFKLTIGSTPTAATCTITFPNTAINGWSCSASDITTQSSSVFVQRQVGGSATTAIIGNYNTAAVLTAFVAADVVAMNCSAY